MDIRIEVFSKVFRPACYGDSVHCPVLFTDEMYNCKHFDECEQKTIENFNKSIKKDVNQIMRDLGMERNETS